jgi:hypothetical protein
MQTSSITRKAGFVFLFVATLALFFGSFARESHALQNTGGGGCVYCDCVVLPGGSMSCICPDSTYVGHKNCEIKEAWLTHSMSCKGTGGVCSPILGGGGGTWLP